MKEVGGAITDRRCDGSSHFMTGGSEYQFGHNSSGEGGRMARPEKRNCWGAQVLKKKEALGGRKPSRKEE